MAARAAAIGELAWNASRAYAGFRIVLKFLLTGIIVILLLWVALEAVGNAPRLPQLVLSLERGFELTAAVVLLVLLALSAHYEVPVRTTQRLIASGLLAYSLVQVLNDSISRQWLDSYFHSWNVIREVSFHAALVLWLVALWKPLPAPATAAPAPDMESVAAFMRQGTQVIHDLAGRLRHFRRNPQK